MLLSCQHPYRFPAEKPGAFFCPTCRRLIEGEVEPTESKELVMPSRLIEINEVWWERNRPWKRMSYKLAKKYDWYISMDHGSWRLIMPVKRDGVDVFYSARHLDTMNTFPAVKKYMYPEGVDKHVFISGPIGKLVGITEGIADAAYASQVLPCIAVLGGYYLDSLAEIVPRGTTMITLFDGDMAGYISAIKFQTDCTIHDQQCYIGMIPPGLDPTDLGLQRLKNIIRGTLHRGGK